MQPKESIQLMQVRRWSSAALNDELTFSHRPPSLRNQFNSCKSDDGGQQLKLTSSAKNRPCSLRNQSNSCKSDGGDQQLALTSSAKNEPCSQGISSTQATTLEAQQLILTTSPFYSGHADQMPVQPGQNSPQSLSGQIERRQLYSYPTRTFKPGQAA